MVVHFGMTTSQRAELDTKRTLVILFPPLASILTVNADFDALGNRWGHPVGCNAKIGAHVQSWDTGYLQSVALPLVHCNRRRRRKQNSGLSLNDWCLGQRQHLPMWFLLMAIRELSSRFHLIMGRGLPLARHLSEMLAPSRTMTSLELSESSMLGGTESRCNQSHKCIQ